MIPNNFIYVLDETGSKRTSKPFSFSSLKLILLYNIKQLKIKHLLIANEQILNNLIHPCKTLFL